MLYVIHVSRDIFVEGLIRETKGHGSCALEPCDVGADRGVDNES